MDLARSQKIVRVLGILDIVGAVLSLVGGIGMMGLGGVGATLPEMATDNDLRTGVGVFMFLGIILIVTGIANLLEGIFAVRAEKDASKVGPLWIFAIVTIILGVLALVTSIVNDGQDTLSSIFSLAVNCFMFYLANNIKKLSNN